MAKTLPEAFKQAVPTVIEVPFPPTPDPWSVIIPRRNRPAAYFQIIGLSLVF